MIPLDDIYDMSLEDIYDMSLDDIYDMYLDTLRWPFSGFDAKDSPKKSALNFRRSTSGRRNIMYR